MAKQTAYQRDLIAALKDPREAAAYLNAAIEDGERGTFLLALRNVTEVCGGMTALAERSRLSRESLYRILSNQGNPDIKDLTAILHAMGLKLAVEPERREASIE